MAVKDEVEKDEEKPGVQDACNLLLEHLTEELVQIDSRRVELHGAIRTIQMLRDDEGKKFMHDMMDRLGSIGKEPPK